MWNDRKKMGVKKDFTPTYLEKSVSGSNLFMAWRRLWNLSSALTKIVLSPVSLCKKNNSKHLHNSVNGEQILKKDIFLKGIKIIISRYNPHLLQLNFILHTSHCGVLSWLQGFPQYLKKKKKCTAMTRNLNLLTAVMSVENDQQECEILNPYVFFFFKLACEMIFTKTHSRESRFFIRPENILFASVCWHFSAWKFDRLGQWRG